LSHLFYTILSLQSFYVDCIERLFVCENRVTAVKGNYMIGVYTLRKIEFGEELTFDYCCVTESKDEHDSSVCLCGSQGCKGSYLCYTGPGAYDEVLKEYHGLLDRHNLLLQACTSGRVTQRESEDLKQAGLATCLLHGLPDWVIKYAAGVVRALFGLPSFLKCRWGLV
jgi:hypothetical protein